MLVNIPAPWSILGMGIQPFSIAQWIGLWENLQVEFALIFHGKNPWLSGSHFPINQWLEYIIHRLSIDYP